MRNEVVRRHVVAVELRGFDEPHLEPEVVLARERPLQPRELLVQRRSIRRTRWD